MNTDTSETSPEQLAIGGFVMDCGRSLCEHEHLLPGVHPVREEWIHTSSTVLRVVFRFGNTNHEGKKGDGQCYAAEKPYCRGYWRG
jgi:hypothetical protein